MKIGPFRFIDFTIVPNSTKDWEYINVYHFLLSTYSSFIIHLIHVHVFDKSGKREFHRVSDNYFKEEFVRAEKGLVGILLSVVYLVIFSNS